MEGFEEYLPRIEASSEKDALLEQANELILAVLPLDPLAPEPAIKLFDDSGVFSDEVCLDVTL